MDGNSLYFLSNISSMFVKGGGGVILVSKGRQFNALMALLPSALEITKSCTQFHVYAKGGREGKWIADQTEGGHFFV